MPTYNDPAIGQAFQNLASAFAPPSGSDLSGYANAAATREKAKRLSELFGYAQGGDFNQAMFDRMGQATGQWTPSSGYYGVNTQAATARRGQDITAETDLTMNAADNERARDTNRLDNQTSAITSLFEPLDPDQVAPEVPQELMGVLGLPGVDQRSGLPGRPTEDEIIGGIIANMPTEQQQAIAFGNTPLEQVIMGGEEQFATRPDAIGATPAQSGNKAARKDAVAVIDGQTVPVTRGPDEMSWRTADGQPIPENAQVFSLPSPEGSAEDVGMTGAVTSDVQNQIINTQQTLDTARQLRSMIQESPSSQGLVGMIRGTAQDAIQTGNDLGQFFGEGLADVNRAVESGMADAGLQSEYFDPSIPAIEMTTNLLAWQYAKSMSGARVSNEQLRQAREAIGGSGMFANRANSLARLDELIGSWEGQLEQLQSLQPDFGIQGERPTGAPEGNPVGIPTIEDAPAPPAPPSPPEPPQADQSTIPSIQSDAEYENLPSGAVFRDPDGNLRRKP